MSHFRTELTPPQFPLFDVHVHLGASDTGEIYYPHLGGDEYLRHMADTPIQRACAFAPLRHDGYAVANRELLAWSQGTGGKILPFARLGGSQPITEPRLWMLRRWLRSRVMPRPPDIDTLDALKHYAGIKLLPHLDGVPSQAAFARINELGLPVLIHGGVYSSPGWIEQAILPHVQTTLIIAHLGAFPADERLLRDAVELAGRVERVYLDTSGAWMANFLRYAVQHVPHKLLFGSDAPLAHPMVAWYHVAAVVQDDRLLEQIGYQASEAIFL